MSFAANPRFIREGVFAQQAFMTGVYTLGAVYNLWLDQKGAAFFISCLALTNMPLTYSMAKDLYPNQVRRFEAEIGRVQENITNSARAVLQNLSIV